MDATTVSYLLKAALKKKEEERKVQKRLEREQRRQQAFWDQFAEKERQRTSRRKRKKRRKKRLPKSSARSFLRSSGWEIWTLFHGPFRLAVSCSVSWCCSVQQRIQSMRQFSEALDIFLVFYVFLDSDPEVVPESGHSSTHPWYLAATGSVFALPRMYRKIDFSARQLQPVSPTSPWYVQILDKVMVIPIVGLHSPDSPEARGDSTGAVLGQGYGFVDVVPWSRRCRTPSGGAAVAVHLQRRQHPCGDAKVILLAQTVQHSVEIPQLLVDKVVDVPVVQLQQVPHALMVQTVQNTRFLRQFLVPTSMVEYASRDREGYASV